MNDVMLNVRIPNELAARLAEHRKRTMVPTSAFVRRAIEELLNPTGVDAALEAEIEDGTVSIASLLEK